MPVRIRLQRHGRKGKPFYWIVAADSRAKRDGKFLEKLGTYNPNTNPAQIDVNIENSITWLKNGAQPSETVKRMLSYKGVLLKYHLLRGVEKGALTEEQAAQKFQQWLDEKTNKVEGKKEDLSKAKAAEKAKILKAEKEVSDKRRTNQEVTENNEVAATKPPEDTATTSAEKEEKPSTETEEKAS